MIRIKVEYAAQLRQALSIREESWEFEIPPSLDDLLGKVAERHGRVLAKYQSGSTAEAGANGAGRMDRKGLDAGQSASVGAPGGSLWNTFLLARNDEQVFLEDRIALEDRDVVTIMTPMSGG